jgi:hypothetical protein
MAFMLRYKLVILNNYSIEKGGSTLRKKLRYLKRRFGENAVREAIIMVGLAKAEAYLCHGGHCSES